jgi:hypothetical protein
MRKLDATLFSIADFMVCMTIFSAGLDIAV